MAGPFPERRRVTLDSAQLRCLAHPLRSRLLSALRLDGPSTSARLAARLATNTGATSYHLRQLADAGLVEEDPDRGTARERWWRAAHDITSYVDTDFDADPDDRAAAEWLVGHHARQKTRWRDDYLESRAQWPAEWRAAASLGDVRLRLTADQLARLTEELYDVLRRYDELPVEDDAEGDTEQVMILLDAFPVHDVRL
jgi:DNA-binding transcriptional ArsR family regulator